MLHPCCAADDAQLAAAEAAAAALAAGGIPEAALNFDEHAVGPFGAGYAWAAAGSDSVGAQLPLLAGNQSPGSECDSEAEEFTKVGARKPVTVLGGVQKAAVRNEARRLPRAASLPAVRPSYAMCMCLSGVVCCLQEVLGAEEPGLEEQSQGADQFNREVAETFLRCVKERISHDNAVIELNGLKIAEDRTFADCARCVIRYKVDHTALQHKLCAADASSSAWQRWVTCVLQTCWVAPLETWRGLLA